MREKQARKPGLQREFSTSNGTVGTNVGCLFPATRYTSRIPVRGGVLAVGGRRILLVEDDPTQQAMYSSLLYYNGYEVETAGSTAEAMQKAATSVPDAILMDVLLPDGSGVAAAATIKSVQSLRHIPIICMTAYNVREQEVLSAGCARLLRKPFDGTLLVHAIENAVARPSPE